MIFRMSRGIISRDFSLHNLSVGFDEFSQKEKKIINPNYFHLIALTMRILWWKKRSEKSQKRFFFWQEGGEKIIWGGKN